MSTSIAGATGDPLPAPALTEGQWQSIGIGHQLIYLGSDAVLDWVPITGDYRVWKVNRSVSGGADPLPAPAVSQGTWTTVNIGHKLVYLGNDRVLDWQPAQRRYRVWRINRAAIGNADPLSGLPQTEGIWANIGSGHQLISLGGNRVLDWVPATGDYHIWRHDPAAVGAADPLPAPALTQGQWESIRIGHRLIPVGADRVLDWVPATGDFRVWRYDRTAIGDPFPGEPEVRGQWETIRLGHELVFVENDRVLDWEPASGNFRMWKYDRNVTTLRRTRVRIHVKVLELPSHVTIDRMIQNAKTLYASYGVEIIEVSREFLNTGDFDIVNFQTVFIGECLLGQPTAHLTDLHNRLRVTDLHTLRTEIAPTDIVIYFVRTLVPADRGCSSHPPGKPGAVVSASQAKEWTLAHEIGHVLGLEHVLDENRLMFLSTSQITNLPPDLSADDIAKILASDLSQE